MKTFPMFIKTSKRKIVIIGGGEEAIRKCRLALKTDAKICVVACELDPELASLADDGKILIVNEASGIDVFKNTAIAFIATGEEVRDLEWAKLARKAGAVVNVVDRPEHCDAFTPSIVDRDPLVIAIGSEGAAPVLARQIKTKLESWLEPRLGEFVALAGRLRGFATERIDQSKHRELWRWVFTDTPRKLFAAGKEREASQLVKDTIASGKVPSDSRKPIALVGAGPGAPDLLTLRAVQRLQEADIIFYDRLVGGGILELARRDAERVYVGKTPGAMTWPQEKINALLVSAAEQGKAVVRLKCGDPGMFGRGFEEANAIKDAGLDFEIVPGITSAVAASAATGQFLTKRGEIETTVFATGHLQEDITSSNWISHLAPGASVSIYMGVGEAESIQRIGLAAGCPPALSIIVIERATHPDQKHIETTLGNLERDIKANSISAPAIIQIQYPKNLDLTQICQKGNVRVS